MLPPSFALLHWPLPPFWGFLDFRKVSSSLELKTFFLSICIRAPESTTNSRSSSFFRRGCRHYPFFGRRVERRFILFFETVDIFAQSHASLRQDRTPRTRATDAHFFSCCLHAKHHQRTRVGSRVWSVCLCAPIISHSFVSCSVVHFLMFQIRSFRSPSAPLPTQPSVLQAGTGMNTFANPRSGLLFGRMAEHSHLTGYEPKSLIEVSSEFSPINFPREKTASTQTSTISRPRLLHLKITDTKEAEQLTSLLFTQEREVSANSFGVAGSQQAPASGSKQQPASSNVVNPWQDIDLMSLGTSSEVLSHFHVLRGHC